MKYSKEFREHFKLVPAFSARDVRLFLAKKGISRQYAYLLLHNAIASGEVKRITKGVYSFKEEVQVVGFAFQPYYYGLQDALSFHDLWEQETNPVVITPRKVRPGMRTFLGNNYLVKRIDRSMFFGFQTIKYSDFWIRVSDVEKTLVDFAYFKQPLGKPVLKEIRSRLRKPVLQEYLKRSPPRVRKKIAAWLRR